MEAQRRKASALRFRHSQSLASRRQRLSQAMVRSTIQRLGSTTNLRSVGSLDDLDVDLAADAAQSRLELGALVAAVGVELQQERVQAEQRAHQQHAAIAVLDVGGMHDGLHQQALRIDQDMALLAFDLLARVVARRVDASAPLFRALDALAVDDRGRRAGLTPGLLAALHVERVMDAIERAGPQSQRRR